MIAYNKIWLHNLHVKEQLEEAFEKGCIDEDELAGVSAEHPDGFYHPNYFVALGLFLLTVVIICCAFGLFSLMVVTTQSDRIFGAGAIVFGCITYLVLEVGIKKVHFKSGVDTALIWMSPVLVISGIMLVSDLSTAWYTAIVLALAAFISIRFADAGLALVACLAFLYWNFKVAAFFGDIGKSLAPFLIMIWSAIIYWTAHRQKRSSSLRYYENCFVLLEITALLCFYTACNYYVVRETSVAVFHLSLAPGDSIPLGWLFWILTVLVPLIYLAAGIYRKDIILIRTSLIPVAAAAFTIRYYYHVFSTELTLVLGGSLLIGIAWNLIRYLKKPKFGYTAETEHPKEQGRKQMESLLISGVTGNAHSSAPTEFHGGSGSGGGAGGQF